MTNAELTAASKIMIGTTQASAVYIGSTKVWPSVPSSPYDSQLEYLEFDGHQCIELPFSVNYSVYIKVQFTKIVAQARIYGTAPNHTIAAYINGQKKLAFSRTGDWFNANINPDTNTIYEYYYDRSTKKMYINNTLKKTYTAAEDDETTIYLGAASAEAVDANAKCLRGRIYKFTMWNSDNTVKIMDLIPVRKNGVGYMYDKVSGTLYGKTQDSQALILGPDKGYVQLEYIESTGNQCIELYEGYDPNIDWGYWDINAEYKIYIKYNVPSSNQTTQAALWALGNDYGPTLYYNSTSGMYWKYPLTAYNVYFSHISPTPLNDRQIKISDHDVLAEGTIEYTCIANESQYTAWAPTLFARPTSTSQDATELTVDRKIKAKLYAYKMWKNGQLVMDCIPYRDPDDVVGLYDIVNNHFLTSFNDVAFVAGPMIQS